MSYKFFQNRGTFFLLLRECSHSCSNSGLFSIPEKCLHEECQMTSEVGILCPEHSFSCSYFTNFLTPYLNILAVCVYAMPSMGLCINVILTKPILQEQPQP